MANKFLTWIKKNKWKLISLILFVIILKLIYELLYWYGGYMLLYECYTTGVPHCEAIVP